MIVIPEIGLAIHNVIGGHTEYLEEYMALYEEYLPQYMRYAPAMRQRAVAPVDPAAIEIWYQWVIRVKDRPVGIIGFLYNCKRNVGIMVDFAIEPEIRNFQYQNHPTFASLIIEIAMEQLRHDALEHGYRAPLGLIAEVEHEHLARKYGEYGYLRLPVEYQEPPYTPELANLLPDKQDLDQIGFVPLYLGIFQPSDCLLNPNDPRLINTVLLTLFEDHYHLPSEHWLIQKLLRATIPEEMHHDSYRTKNGPA